jgi:hypothetical protein
MNSTLTSWPSARFATRCCTVLMNLDLERLLSCAMRKARQTRALFCLEARGGVEPPWTDFQSAAQLLCWHGTASGPVGLATRP